MLIRASHKQLINQIKERVILGRKRTKPPVWSPFGERLAQLRKAKSFTLTALSQLTGISISYLSMLEAGERLPSRERVLKLAQALLDNLASPDELLLLAGLSPTQTEQLVARDLANSYEVLLHHDPHDFRAFQALIRMLVQKGQTETARSRIIQGMQNFTQAYQLQALLSQLELSRNNPEAALTAQRTALQQFEAQYQIDNLHLSERELYADLQANLGAIFFVSGLQQLETSDPPAEPNTALEQASFWYEKALALIPEDIYLLDEYARICFQIAEFSPPPQQSVLWQRCIQLYLTLVWSPNNHALGLQSVREASARLAHTYSKSGRFEEASALIGVMGACNPSIWLFHYVRACHCSLRYAQKPQPELLQQGLDSLRWAIEIEDAHNTAASDASHDPDLQALRLAAPEAFQAVLTFS